MEMFRENNLLYVFLIVVLDIDCASLYFRINFFFKKVRKKIDFFPENILHFCEINRLGKKTKNLMIHQNSHFTSK